ncbi:MAG: glycosyltransferase [Patescibacteria group bacterium]|nr:glycosyltransferase [Patescibacteria group bacterium]
MKIAIAHDFLNQLGGAEKVLLDLCKIFPDAPVYTLVYDEKATQGLFKHIDIRTSWLQKFPRWMRVHGRKLLLPFCARAVESLNLNEFDLVISDANPWVKGLILSQKTIHVSYLHAATRFMWDWKEEYLQEQNLNFVTKYFVQKMLFRARQWDQLAAWRPDYLLANSKTTAQRIWKYYRREAVPLYPGVEAVEKYQPTNKNDGYFFAISRLSPYKKMDLIVRVFNKLNLPLKIAGDGSAQASLEKMANSNVKILGRVSEEEKQDLYQNCIGFITLADDDFGITTIEAHAAGKPVIALRAGGACELIAEGKNGIFVESLSEASLENALKKFRTIKWDVTGIHASAIQYSPENFKKNLLDFIQKLK